MGLNDIMRKVAEQHQQPTESSKECAIEIKAGVELIDIADKELTEDMIVLDAPYINETGLSKHFGLRIKSARLNLKQQRNSMPRKHKRKRGGR